MVNPHDFLSYDPQTGNLNWKISRNSYGGGRRVGDRAGSLSAVNGYRHIRLNGTLYREHRLAWFMVYGRWPSVVDHINGNRSDNRLINLREASVSGNCINRPARHGRKYKGIWFDKATGKWRAQIKSDGRVVTPARFSTEADAAICYNYHSAYMHGDFAHLNKIAACDFTHE